VIDAARPDSESDVLTRLVVVAHSNVKFSGTITGIGREPARLLVTGDNGQSLNILVTDRTTVVLDGRGVQFSAIRTGMTVVNGVYAVAGLGGALYNVATIVSIESPKVVRASGIITSVNAIDGILVVLSGKSDQTKILRLKLPEIPLGENLVKDGLPIQSLLEVERGDRVDIVFYVLESGIIEKLSVVSDDFIQTRGTLLGVAENYRFATVELVNGEEFDLWVGPRSSLRLNGRRVPTLRPVAELFNDAVRRGTDISALVPEVLFFRDSLDSNRGVIISIEFQISVETVLGSDGGGGDSDVVELTVSGVIEAISGNTWVIDGNVFTVSGSTRFAGGDAKVGVVAIAELVSRRGGAFHARLVNITGLPAE
jgi:hypothetical protein